MDEIKEAHRQDFFSAKARSSTPLKKNSSAMGARRSKRHSSEIGKFCIILKDSRKVFGSHVKVNPSHIYVNPMTKSIGRRPIHRGGRKILACTFPRPNALGDIFFIQMRMREKIKKNV